MKIDKLFEHLLNEVSQDYSQLTTEEISNKGLKDPNFDFKKGFDALIEKDRTGHWIYLAGKHWKTFDYKKGLDALIEIDEICEYIYYAGLDWKTFDFNKGLDALKTKDKTGQWVYDAGRYWKEFDFKKGLDALITIDKDGEFIYYSGKDWDSFDFNKGFKALEKTSDKIWFKKAKKKWPKSYPEKLKDVKDKYDENHIPGKRKKLKR